MWYALFFIKFFPKTATIPRPRFIVTFKFNLLPVRKTRDPVKSTETFVVRGSWIHFCFRTFSPSLSRDLGGGVVRYPHRLFPCTPPKIHSSSTSRVVHSFSNNLPFLGLLLLPGLPLILPVCRTISPLVSPLNASKNRPNPFSLVPDPLLYVRSSNSIRSGHTTRPRLDVSISATFIRVFLVRYLSAR